MKKVLFFIESLAGGGAEKVLTTLVKNLDRQKYDITVLLVSKTGVYVKEVEKHCRLISMLPDYSSLSGMFDKIKYRYNYKWIYRAKPEKIYKKYISEHYDIEVAFVEGFATKIIAASTNKKSKKICWLHIDMENNPYADQYYSSLDEERAVYQKFDKIVGVSKSVKYAFENKFDLKNSVDVIYNPIDSKDIILRAKQDSHTRLDKEEGLKIISIGRLEKQKGYDRLIKGLKKIDYKKYPFHLWILGEGSERAYLEQIIREFGLEKQIDLLGFQENPYAWLAAADVFVCSSRAEGYSLAIAESMILGLPVLSVDCAGPNELLDFGKYGLLIPNTDEDLEEDLKSMIEGKINLVKYAQLSEKRQQFFELTSVLEKVEKLLMEE